MHHGPRPATCLGLARGENPEYWWQVQGGGARGQQVSGCITKATAPSLLSCSKPLSHVACLSLAACSHRRPTQPTPMPAPMSSRGYRTGLFSAMLKAIDSLDLGLVPDLDLDLDPDPGLGP